MACIDEFEMIHQKPLLFSICSYCLTELDR